MEFNSKMIVFHKQGVNKFPIIIHLKGAWEVALVECAFRKSWPTLTISQRIKLLYYEENQVKELYSNTALLKSENYSINELVEECLSMAQQKFYERIGDNLCLKGMSTKKITTYPTLVYNKQNGRVSMTPGVINSHDLFYIGFDKYLGDVLGFPENELLAHVENKLAINSTATEVRVPPIFETFSLFPIKMSAIELLYVTSDICDYSLVNNEMLNLMRILKIPINALHNELLHYHFETPIYLPVNKSNLESINLELNERNYNNKLINFNIERFLFCSTFSQSSK